MEYVTGAIVRNNRFTHTAATLNTVGIHLNNSTGNCQVTRNHVVGFSRMGIWMQNVLGSAGARVVVANNYVNSGAASTSRYGIQIDGGGYSWVVYNTVVMPTCTAGTLNSSSTTLYINGSSNTDIRNNILVSNCGGYTIAIPTAANVASCDYNCLLTSGTNIGWHGAVRTTLANWIANTPLDDNSLSQDPGFSSSTDYPITNTNLLGAGSATGMPVTDDIQGEARPGSNPDIGCDETVAGVNDAGVSVMAAPTFPYCAGVTDVYVRIRNFGIANLTSATINWSVNGVAQTPFAWTGSLATATTSANINIGNYNFLMNTRYTLRFWTTVPNGATDGNTANDELVVSNIPTAMAGTYTLAPAGDFTSFQAAVDSLIAKGICNDVTINVAAGTYTEQISIPPISGAGTATGPGKNASASQNRITFQGATGDSTDVVLTFGAATFANNYVLQLDGADYITIRKMTVRSTDPFDNQVIRLQATATQNILENNVLETIAGANADDVVYSNTVTDSVNTIQYNHILNGRSGINFTGGTLATHNRKLTIYGNTLENYRYGIYIEFVDQTSITANRIFNAASFNAAATEGIYLFGVDNGLTIGSNIITKTQGTNNYGIEILNCTGAMTGPCATGSDNGNIYNNKILVGGTGTSEGIYMNASENHHFFYNTIHTTGTNPTSARAFYINGPFSVTPALNANVVLQNNNLTADVGMALYNSVGGIITADHNNLFVFAGTDIAHWITTDYATIATLAAGSGMNGNSLQVDPEYTSATDISVNSTALDNVGAVITCITTDIDGTARTATPGIGANEPVVALPLAAGRLEAIPTGSSDVQIRWMAPKGIAAGADAVLERSTDGNNFVYLGTHVPAIGLYTTQDRGLSEGTWYYRARFSTPQGQQAYTNTAAVTLSTSGVLLLMPNPALPGQQLGLQLYMPQAGSVQLHLTDAEGRTVRSLSLPYAEAGWHTLQLEPITAKGVYALRASLPGQVLVRRWVVQ